MATGELDPDMTGRRDGHQVGPFDANDVEQVRERIGLVLRGTADRTGVSS